MKIKTFWEVEYLPYLERATKESTRHGYLKIWNQRLDIEFSGKTLRGYQSHDATKFLTHLAENNLGSRTIAHTRSLASGLFSYATAVGLIPANPWREAKLLIRPRAPEPTTAYTMQEVQQMLSVLQGEAQLAVALAAFAGLRPSEISGLRFEDIEDGWLNIQRSVWHGVISVPKTQGSAARVPLLPALQTLLAAMPRKKGWVLSERGGPVNIYEFARSVIGPALQKHRIEWKGLYCARRSAGTLVTELSNNPFAAAALLRHSSAHTTLTFYFRPERERLALQGMRALDTALGPQRALGAGGEQ